MTVSTRAAVLTLIIGFLIEGVGEAYELLNQTSIHGNLIWLYAIGPATTFLGFLFVFFGRHEWSETHKRHVKHGHRMLLVAIIALGGAAVATLALVTSHQGSVPSWVPWAIGAVAAFGLFSAFLSYGLIAFHITTREGQGVLIGALAWAAAVSIALGYEVAMAFPGILRTAPSAPFSVTSYIAPLSFWTTLTFVSYFLLTAGYFLAYHNLSRGVLPAGEIRAVRTRPPSPPAVPNAHP